MPSEVADLYVTLRSITEPFKRGMKEAAVSAEADTAAIKSKTGSLGPMFLGVAASVAAIGYEAVKLGSTFQAQMETLATQAGVPQAQIASLSRGVLQLAGQVGFAPDSLAEALYHIESSFASVGITGPQAMNLLKVAAEGAAVGHANLVDVTNALDAAVASGIPGVQNLTQAMGVLNATVGAGDMQMQDLANAFSTGLLATVKGYGLSITDVGAALATFGDNNIRGANAATELRMAVQALAVPAKAGSAELGKLGLKSDTLAKDLQSGGLLKALQDLKSHMDAAGVSTKQQGQILTDVFGKKAGTGINVLYDQLSRLQSKYPELAKSANGFGDAWEKTKGTFSQAMNSVSATVQSLLTQLGLRLMPVLTRVANWFVGSVSWLEHHRAVLYILAGVIGGALVSALYAAVTATIAWTAALDVNPIFLVITAIAGLVGGLIYAYQHFKTFRDIVDAVGRFFKATWQEAVHLAGEAIQWFMNGPMVWIRQRIAEFQAFWKQHGADITRVAKEVWEHVWGFIKFNWDLIYGLLKIGLSALMQIWHVVWDFTKNDVKLVWDFVKDIVTAGWHYVLNGIGLFADLLTGKWGKLWGDVKQLVSQAWRDVNKIFADFAKNALNLLVQAGKDIIHGLINGLESAAGGLAGTVKSLANDVTSVFGFHIGAHSPSRVFHEFGRNIGQGLVNGMDSMRGEVAASVGRLAQTVTAGGPSASVISTRRPGGVPVLVGGGSSFAAQGASAGNTYITINNNFAGSLYAESQLRAMVQSQSLQYSSRNTGNGLSYTAVR